LVVEPSPSWPTIGRALNHDLQPKGFTLGGDGSNVAYGCTPSVSRHGVSGFCSASFLRGSAPQGLVACNHLQPAATLPPPSSLRLSPRIEGWWSTCHPTDHWPAQLGDNLAMTINPLVHAEGVMVVAAWKMVVPLPSLCSASFLWGRDRLFLVGQREHQRLQQPIFANTPQKWRRIHWR